MPTIAQAQARFLKSGGLSRLGTDRPVSQNLGTVKAMLALYAEEFITLANQKLNENNSVNTGTLSDSIDFQVTRMGTAFNLKLLVADYYDYVNKGVQGKGKKNQNKTSPYKFKFINPSKSHVEAIRKWIKEGRQKVKVSDIKYGKTRQEGKAIPIGKKEQSLAYIIARSTKQKGLRATNFWDDSFNTTFKDLGLQLSKALGFDINIDLNNIVQGVKKKR